MQAFSDGVLSLIVQTSTNLPPDVRAAMKVAMAEEPASTQSGQPAQGHRAGVSGRALCARLDIFGF